MFAASGKKPFVYEGDRLRAFAFPLGGIGTGHFCLSGDGGFRQWQIFNEVNHMAYLPDTFLSVRVRRAHEEPVTRLLQSPFLYNKEFEAAPSVSDHIVPEGARMLVETLPGVERIRMEAVYPVVCAEYSDDALPVDLSLEAFSPFVPLDSKNSGLPLAFLVVQVSNPLEDSVEFSVMASLQNAVGWDGLTPISGLSNPLYGGNRNRLVKEKGRTIILMDNSCVEARSPRHGEMALFLLGEATARPQWDDLGALWQDFLTDGELRECAKGRSPNGKTWNGALSFSVTLGPLEKREIIFGFAWYFPNRYVNWDQKGLGVTDDKSLFWLGNMYANWFGGVLDVVEYACENWQLLRSETETFALSLLGSALPEPVLDAVSSQISTIRSPTCFRTCDGRFFGFEGCRGSSTGSSCQVGGCCPLNCTHVWNYEQTLSRLFPDLEATMRETDLEFQMGEDGRIPHRTVLPLYLPRWRGESPTSSAYAADGQCGTILKVYREFRASGDRERLDRLWSKVKSAMEFAVKTWDPDLEGVFRGPQWNTYDLHLYGHNSFVSGLYLAALRAIEEMAKIQGDEEVATSHRRLFERGRSRIEEELWNGEYYVQVYDSDRHSRQYGTGCHSDQLLGQWWANILDLGQILPREHVLKALSSINRYNLRANMIGHVQNPRVYLREEEGGLLNCTWPKGGRREPVMLYSDEVWTGIEYAVAGLMFQEGMVEEGTEIARVARARHDGRVRNPWNEVECGDHYVRPMSSWAMLEALSGFLYDASQGKMSFDPRMKAKDFRCLFVAAGGWGVYVQRVTDQQVSELSVMGGVVKLSELSVPRLLSGGVSVSVTIKGGTTQGLSVKTGDSKVTVKGSLKIERGGCLRITLHNRL